MYELYKKYRNLGIDGSLIGLEHDSETGDYFCTPVGARVIGWDNGIHYCFIDGFGEMVFCVNPESCCDFFVYPIAKNFYDFLSLIPASKNANTLQQVICWNRTEYDGSMHDPNTVKRAENPETVSLLNKIKTELCVQPMDNPFEYIKAIQKDFHYSRIKFTNEYNEYYDTLGLERPDGTEPEKQGFDFRTVSFRFEK